MNFTQSFEEFSKGLGTTDLFLYAGIALIAWVLFKDKLSPMQNLLSSLSDSIKKLLVSTKPITQTVVTPPTNNAPAILANTLAENTKTEPEDLFFKLVISWKETRDLASKCGCEKAVEVADTMFPYLSPNVCGKEMNDE